MNDNIRKVVEKLAKDPALRKRVQAAESREEKRRILEAAGLTINFNRADIERENREELGKGLHPGSSGSRARTTTVRSTVEWIGVVVAAAAAAA